MTTTPPTTTPTPANDNKHPILQWLPLLHRTARRLEPREQDREDLVQETIAACLQRWGSYNPNESLPGWLIFNMRERFNFMRKQRSVRAVSCDADEDRRAIIDTVGTAPNQEHAADLSAALVRLNTRDGAILLRVAAGDDGESIGSEHGISRQRVNQIVKRQRKMLEAA